MVTPSMADARRRILAAANENRGRPWNPYRMRHLHRAVAMVRRRRLVSNEVLIAAGFNPVKVVKPK